MNVSRIIQALEHVWPATVIVLQSGREYDEFRRSISPGDMRMSLHHGLRYRDVPVVMGEVPHSFVVYNTPEGPTVQML